MSSRPHCQGWRFPLTVATACLAALWSIAVQAGDFPRVEFPSAGGGVNFTTPSHNIECNFAPTGGTATYKPPRNEAEISCDRAQPTYLRFQMGLRGPATIIKNPGEQPCCSDTNPLPYGSSWRKPPFTCESTAMGLNCERDDGHGFTISRSTAKVY